MNPDRILGRRYTQDVGLAQYDAQRRDVLAASGRYFCGDVYEIRRGAYRFDLGPRLVPVAQLEMGVASLTYSNISQFDGSTGVAFAYASRSETVLEIRGQLRAEYRHGDHLVVGAGIGAVVRPGALNTWSLYLPVSVGYIW